jgi:D-glycero-alpha-D-manno-heptose-7-phosphate kinase
VYSGEAHLSGAIHNDILADYARPGSDVRAAQHRLKEIAYAGKAALEEGDLAAFAELLDENWAAHRRLHPSCTTPRLLELIAVGKAAGAAGAKVCGAGGGGCIIYWCPDLGARRQVERALEDHGCRILPFRVDTDGVRVYQYG